MPIDYTKYPPNWKTEIRPAILKRANDCCEFCGLENGCIVESYRYQNKTEWIRATFGGFDPMSGGKLVKVVLTIAHLDHDEGNHDVSLDRLKALCQLCHLRYDAEEKAKRRLLREKTLNEKK